MYESNLNIMVIEPAEKITKQQRLLIEKRFQSMTGIKLLKFGTCSIKMEYYAHLFSDSVIIQELNNLGILIKEKKKNNFFQRLLNSISKENIKSFGNKKIDCCDLNH